MSCGLIEPRILIANYDVIVEITVSNITNYLNVYSCSLLIEFNILKRIITYW